MIFELPQPLQTIELTMADGAIIRVRRHGNPDGPRLALSHGNGLAINGYAPFWRLFCDRYDVIVFDQRNHGANPYHGEAGHQWATLVSDAQAIWRGIRASWGEKPAAGVFHSLSGVVAIGQALEFGQAWDLLILFDPPLTPPAGHALHDLFVERQRELARRTLRRIERFSDPSALAQRWAQNPIFRRWLPEARAAMAQATLRRDPAGADYVLSCPRELEARIFASSESVPFWTRMDRLRGPVKLVCGDLSDADQNVVSLVGHALAQEYGFAFEAIPHTSHFLQLEQPERCVRAVEEFLRRNALVK